MAEMNGHPAMQVMADFYFTNISNHPVLLTGTFLVAYFWTFGLIPRRRRVTTGHVLVRAPNSQLHGVYPVGPGGTTPGRADWYITPPVRKPGQRLRARAGFVDQFGNEYVTRVMTWNSVP